MKTSYQQYNSEVRMEAKKFGLSDYELINTLADKMREAGEEPNNSGDFKLLALEASIADPNKNKRPLHFFVSDETFLDWLIDCVPTIESGSPEALIDMTGDRPAIIHFPTSSKYTTMLFYMRKNWNAAFGSVKQDTLTSIFVTFSRGNKNKLNGCCMAFHSDHAAKIEKLKLKHLRLVAGIGMYLSCFPEMLIDGAPEDVKHPSYHQYETVKTIGVSPKVKMDERGEVAPHFRRGHFRVLRSDKFTTKRFQVVFVRQCFVKGEAATIVSPEEQ